MSFYAELLLVSQRFPVRTFSWSLSQHPDALGRPDALVQGGTIEVVLDSQPTELLEDWAQHDTKTLDGKLTVFEADSYSVRDTLYFFDAYCVQLHKQFQAAHSVAGMTMHLILSANKLQLDEMEHNNQWPGAASSTT